MPKYLILFVIYLISQATPLQAQPAHSPVDDHATRFVIYYNSDAAPASALIGLPYTHVIYSFITARADAAGQITLVTSDKLDNALGQIAALQADGKQVLISFGGGDMAAQDYATLVGHEAALANALAKHAKHLSFDGVDLDFEISASLHTTPPPDLFDGRQFLISLTTALRTALGADSLLTHAPQPPYLDPDWHGGPYLDVLREVGPLIDWITVQYYNNTGFDDPISPSAEHQPAWSYAGIVSGQYGVSWPAEKTLIGKPVYTKDAISGYVAPADLVATIITPMVNLYGDRFGGLTGWQFSTLTPQHRYWNKQIAPSMGIGKKAKP